MKSAPSPLLDLIPNPKSVNARVTFRVTRPKFATHALTDSLGITDPTQIDSCAYGTGILRVTNYGNHLYTQYVSDIGSAWPTWTDTGIALVAGSRPGVDGGYVWYQKDTYDVAYRNFAAWTTETQMPSSGESSAKILAPISNQRCYATYFSSTSVVLAEVASTGWNVWKGRVYDVTKPRLDAVAFSNGADGQLDYLYYTDRDAGRVIELSYHVDGNVWGLPRSIVAIDAIADDYGLNLNGASVINGKVVVTGRLTRTSDGPSVSMDVYLIGPESFSLGRDMYIANAAIGGPLQLVGAQLLTSGPAGYCVATATQLFGVDTTSLKLTTSDIVNLRLEEAENRSSVLRLAMSPALSHAAISAGSQVELEICYNDNFMTALTGEVDHITANNGDGQDLLVDVISTTAKRVGQWMPEQGIYIPSQDFTISAADDLSQLIRADGNFEVVTATDEPPVPGSPVLYDDSDPIWVWTGVWSTSTYAELYNATAHYCNYEDKKASVTFEGEGFTLLYYTSYTCGVMEVWIDGVLVDTINQYSATPVYQVPYTRHGLSAGSHTVTFRHGTGSANINVDAITIYPTGVSQPAVTTHDDTDPSWTYSGVWTAASAAGFYGNTDHYTSVVGASASFTFDGCGFRLTTYADTNRGVIQVWIDGVHVADQNCYAIAPCFLVYFTKMGLSAGSHTVVFKHGGGGTYIDIDAITIYPMPVSGVFEDDAPQWTYWGFTSATNVPAASANHYRYSSSADPQVKAELTFVGVAFKFSYLSGPDRSLHEIWIDGVKVTTIDAYQAGDQIRATYTSPLLVYGTHTFKLTHGAPIANYITVDNIEIFASVSVAEAPTQCLRPTDTNKLSVLYTASRACAVEPCGRVSTMKLQLIPRSATRVLAWV